MDPRSRRAHMYARRRRTVGMSLFILVAIAAVLVGLNVRDRDTRGKKSASSSPPPTNSAGGGHASNTPSTPHPIPGYLLIADRGNNRALLVGNDKKIPWRAPPPGTRPSSP